MIKIIKLSFVFLLYFVQLSNAQNENSQLRAANEQLILAIDHYDIDEYENAIPFLLIADSLNHNNAQINYYLGECWIKTNHEARALPYLKIAKQLKYPEKEIDFALGIAYKLNHQFTEAIQCFDAYKVLLTNDPKKTLKQNIFTVNRHIENCKIGIELIKNPKKVKIKNLGSAINSKFPDYVPTISADETELIFTSRRPNTTGGNIDPLDNHYFEDIYISHKNDTIWDSASKLSFGINTNSHDACAGLSPDGNEMYIYRSVKNQKKLSGDIFVSDLKGDIWTTPVAMNANINSASWEPSASTTMDKKSFYFTSDRPGGFGGRDIYMCRKDANGNYGKAINLGPKINTEYDEDAPFIHLDGHTLYFSSMGHKTMGGFDIFHCKINPETGQILSEPENIGFPINTADDDIYFAWSADGKRAYFSSDRQGGFGDKDIYTLERNNTEAIIVILKGIVKDYRSKKPINATVTMVDNSKQEIIGLFNSGNKNGNFTSVLTTGNNYGITVKSPGYLFYSKNITVPEKFDHFEEINDTIYLNPIAIGRKIILRNIFFLSNKTNLLPESGSEINNIYTLMKENSDIKVMISAHCDSDGDDQYNLTLSQGRVESVVQKLISKGIDAKRLVGKGFGETKPLIFPDNTQVKKQQNRRVEFEIIQ